MLQGELLCLETSMFIFSLEEPPKHSTREQRTHEFRNHEHRAREQRNRERASRVDAKSEQATSSTTADPALRGMYEELQLISAQLKVFIRRY